MLAEKLQQYVDEGTLEQYAELKSELAQSVEEQRSLPPRETVLGLAKLEPQPETNLRDAARQPAHAEGDAGRALVSQVAGWWCSRIAASPAEGSFGRSPSRTWPIGWPPTTIG